MCLKFPANASRSHNPRSMFLKAGRSVLEPMIYVPFINSLSCAAERSRGAGGKAGEPGASPSVIGIADCVIISMPGPDFVLLYSPRPAALIKDNLYLQITTLHLPTVREKDGGF